MKDSNLLKLSLSVSLVGLLALLVLSEFVDPTPTAVGELNQKIGDYVYVEGEVESARYGESTAFFTVADETDDILVVVFEELEPSIAEGDLVGVSGEVSLYKGKMEIIADRLVCIRCGS